jgi:hypothetical protein
VLDGKARGVFHGTILVRKDAQKTDAMQTNKNLLLSAEALVQSTPALQIFADDVKCKHGSTTGQLDPAALFYLRSRGIGEEAARALLTYAFASDRGGPDPPGAHPGGRDRVPAVAAAAGRRDPGGPGVSATTNHAAAGAPARALDVERVREEFPILRETVHGKPLVYLDNAASAQKPRAVIEAEAAVYETYVPNIHRGVHSLSMRATDAYEAAGRRRGASWGRAHTREIVFTRGTTESINLVASSYGRRHVGRDDEVPHHGDGAPLEHRALADAVRGERAPPARGPPGRPRGRDPRGDGADHRPPHEDGGLLPRLNRASGP